LVVRAIATAVWIGQQGIARRSGPGNGLRPGLAGAGVFGITDRLTRAVAGV